MKLCPKCNETEINDEEELCEKCSEQLKIEKARQQYQESVQKSIEETRRIRHRRNLIMGNNQRRH